MRTTDPTSPADQATVRRMNLSLLMRSLATGGPRSRARLAEHTGLNKSTVSSLVSELMSRGMVTEGSIDRGSVGRPSRAVQIDPAGLRCLGLELNVDYVAGVVMDLTGRVLARRRLFLPILELGPARTLGKVAELAAELIAECDTVPAQVETLHLSVPGMVDVEAGLLAFGPNLHWRQVDIVHTLMGRLQWSNTRICVDNDANLGAMAEYSAGAFAGTANLLYLSGEIGVGAGIIVEGRIHRGGTGFAGEVGHMPLADPGTECGCGRFGCWETAVGLQAVPGALPTEPRSGDVLVGEVDVRLADILRRAKAGDAEAGEQLDVMAHWLGVGASVLANMLGPEVIIFGGHFAVLKEYLDPRTRAEFDARLVAGGTTTRIEYSTLGFEAPALGGGFAGIDLILGDPSLVGSHLLAAELP